MNLNHVLPLAGVLIVILCLGSKAKNALDRAVLRRSRVEIDYSFAGHHIGNEVLKGTSPETIVAMMVVAVERARQRGFVLTGEPINTTTKGKQMWRIDINIPASLQDVCGMLKISVVITPPSSR